MGFIYRDIFYYNNLMLLMYVCNSVSYSKHYTRRYLLANVSSHNELIIPRTYSHFLNYNTIPWKVCVRFLTYRTTIQNYQVYKTTENDTYAWYIIIWKPDIHFLLLCVPSFCHRDYAKITIYGRTFWILMKHNFIFACWIKTW